MESAGVVVVGSLVVVGLVIGQTADYRGYSRHNFVVAGRNAVIVEPKSPKSGNPWVWRMEFFDHRPEFDLAMLAKGYRLAFIDVGNTFGSPGAVENLSAFYRFAVARGLGKKTILEGLSRGGLYAYQWAARNPDKVSVIYGDAPVCDFKTWPFGQSGGKRSDSDCRELVKAYGFPNETVALAYPFNPVDNLSAIARSRVPIIHVVGDADDVVPVGPNTGLVEKRYRALGGRIKVIHKAGIGHHPHGLDDPSPIVRFVEEHEHDSGTWPPATMIASPNPESRFDSAGWLGRTWLDQHEDAVRYAREVQAEIVLLGDSITQGWGGPSRRVSAGTPDYFRKYFGKYRVANMGMSGDRVQNLKWRLEQGALKGFSPKYVVVHIGTNNVMSDDPADIVKGIDQVVQTIRREAPSAHILLFSVFPLGNAIEGPLRDASHEIMMGLLKLRYRGAIRYSMGVDYMYLPDGRPDPTRIAPDGIHLVSGGYEAWGKRILSEISDIERYGTLIKTSHFRDEPGNTRSRR